MNILKSVVLLISVLMIACSSSRAKTVDSSSKEWGGVSEVRNPGKFKEVQMSTVADIYYVQRKGNPYMRISGNKEFVERIKTDVDGRTLRIYSDKEYKGKNNEKVKIEIFSPSVEKISVSGVGNVYMNEKVALGDLELQVSGVGNMNITDLSCKNLTAKVSGVGNMDIAGKCRTAELSMSGVGHIDCNELSGKIESCSVGGVGSVKTANGKIKNP